MQYTDLILSNICATAANSSTNVPKSVVVPYRISRSRSERNEDGGVYCESVFETSGALKYTFSADICLSLGSVAVATKPNDRALAPSSRYSAPSSEHVAGGNAIALKILE